MAKGCASAQCVPLRRQAAVKSTKTKSMVILVQQQPPAAAFLHILFLMHILLTVPPPRLCASTYAAEPMDAAELMDAEFSGSTTVVAEVAFKAEAFLRQRSPQVLLVTIAMPPSMQSGASLLEHHILARQ